MSTTKYGRWVLGALLLVAGVACSEGPNAPVKSGAQARFALAPRFSSEAAAVYAQRATNALVNFDRVRVVIVRPPSDTVADTTIVFGPDSPSATLELNVEAKTPGEMFNGAIDYTNNGSVVYHGETRLQAHAADEPAPTPQDIEIRYVGIGSNAARVVVSPATVTVFPPTPIPFTAAVFDANNTQISNVPLEWTTSDPSIAVISANGTLVPSGRRGTVTVTATTVTKVRASATASVVLPPSAISLVSGGGQTGKAGALLSAAGVVRVTASDGIGVPGVTVNFAAPTGGAVGSSSVATDANGVASTSLRLGGTLGPQSFAASAIGFSVAIPATATPGDPANIAIVSGNNQQDSVKRTLKNPLVVKVTDSFGNPVNDVTVTWARSTGTGAVSATSTKTGADGTAGVSYTLGATSGAETIVASVAGVTAPATFLASTIAGPPAIITIVSGNGQSIRVGQSLAPLVVKVTDADDNPAGNAVVSWTTTKGTITAQSTTDVQGQTSNTLLLGTSAGSATVTATIANGKSVQFSATVQVGIVAKLAFKSMPTTSTAGSALTVQVELQDAGGNLTAAVNTVTLSLGNAPTGATLSGTLTRAAVGGIATFEDLSINKAGANYTLVATSGGVPTVSTNPFVVNPGPPAQLTIATQPAAAAQSSVALTAQPAVQLYDALQNAVPQAGVTVTAAVATGSGAVGGTATATTNAQGLATFSGLQVRGLVGAYTLQFTSSGLTPATSAAIALSPGLAAQLTFTQQPTTTTAGTALATSPSIVVQDVDGNQIPNATNGVTLGIAAGTGAAGAVLNGTTSLAAAAGAVTFPTLSINLASTTYRLTASSTGLTSATSAVFSIVAGPPSTMVISSGNNQYFPNNLGSTRASQAVVLRDAYTNPVPGISVTFTAGANATVNNQASVIVPTNAAGIADVSTAVVPFTGSVTVTASAATLPNVTFNATRTDQGPWSTSCKLTTTNAAYCWGDNMRGTVGDGTGQSVATPSAVAGGLSFSSLAPSFGSHQCGLVGTAAYCWGKNDYGQIGDNSQTNRLSPTPVQGGLAFTALATSNFTTCGLRNTGQLYCWGWTGGGVLGDGDLGTIRTTPTLVNTGGRVFTKITVTDDYACGLEASGVLSCWGQTPSGNVTTATPVSGAPTLTSLTAGFYHTCGLTAAGTAYCFSSYNARGAAGTGTFTPVPLPTLVSGGLTFTEIRAHAYNTCARTLALTLYCWGDNTTGNGGMVGDGTTIDRAVPTLVLGGLPVSILLGGGIAHTCAAANTGVPFCWGSGALGDTVFASTTPIPVRWVEGPPGTPRSIIMLTGDNTTATAGTAVAGRPTVIVRDYAGNPVVGATVTFTVTGGGGSLTGGSVVTGPGGIATVGSWTLGTTPGVNTLTASIPTIGTVIFVSTGT